MHALVPAAESLYPPARHPVHTATELPPTLLLDLPCAHAVQAEAPDDSVLYVPATQAVHIRDEDDAAAVPYAPAPHEVHTEAPNTEL